MKMLQRPSIFLAVFFTFFLAAVAEARFQRMRVHTGRYRLNGAATANAARVSDRQRVEIPSTCLDEDLGIPEPTHEFTARTSGIKFVDSNGKSVPEDNVKRWFKIKGVDDFNAISIELTPEAPHENFEIIVLEDAPQVVAANNLELDQMVARLGAHASKVRDADSNVALLKSIFGERSALTQRAIEWRQDFDWAVGRPGPVQGQNMPSLASVIKSEVRLLFDLESSSPITIDMIALLLQKEGDPTAIKKLAQNLDIELDKTTPSLRNVRALSKTEDGYCISASDGNARVATDLTSLLRDRSKDDFLITQSTFTTSEVETLNRAGIYVVGDFRSAVGDRLNSPPGVIVVASRANDSATNKLIFDDMPVSGIPKSIERLERLNQLKPDFVVRVETKGQFDEALARFPDSSRPIVVCHNDDGYVRFADDSVDISDIDHSADYLTCNTLGRGILGLRSTGFLNFRDTCDALYDTLRSNIDSQPKPHASGGDDDGNGGGGGGWPGGFGHEYGKKQKKGVLFFLLALGGGGTGIVMLTSGDDDEPKEKSLPPSAPAIPNNTAKP